MEPQADGSVDGSSARTRNVVRVRPVPAGWHPSLSDHGPNDRWPSERPAAGLADEAGPGLDPLTIARLDRAVSSIDRATSRIAAKGGRLAPEVETELLALVGQISLGMIRDAADRAERMARGLGGATSFGS